MKLATKLIHNGYEIDKSTGALSIPIYQASTYNQEDINAPHEYEYSRSGNPTRKALEETIAKLEGGVAGFAFSSGMAAISSVLSIFECGDHIIVCEDVYGGTYRITSKFFTKFGLEFSYVDATDIDTIDDAIKANTKAIFIESPSNPLLKITDIRAVSSLAKANNLLTIIDNTFMSPYLQRPIELGIDIIIHSATKFIGGHSDVLAGLVIVNNLSLANRLYFVQNSFGAVLGPQDSWLLLRGLKTLKIRMESQQKGAIEIADYLNKSNYVNKVYYPGLIHHKGYSIHNKQADGPGCVLSFVLEDRKHVEKFFNEINLSAIAVSLGGVETILSYPVTMSHASIPQDLRKKLNIGDNLVRMSVGLEDTDDLLEDFDNALKKI